MKVAPGVFSTFVLSMLADCVWIPPVAWSVASLWERAGQPLPSKSRGRWPDRVHSSSLLKNNKDEIIMCPSGLYLRRRGGVKSRLFWNRKLLLIKGYQSIILHLDKTFLRRALGKHRCLHSVSWRLCKVWNELGVQSCTVQYRNHQHVATEYLKCDWSKLRGALRVKYTPAFKDSVQKKTAKDPIHNVLLITWWNNIFDMWVKY